jgi:type VI secretion system protein
MVLICALFCAACGGGAPGAPAIPAIPALPKGLKIPGLPKLGGSKKPNQKFTMQINVADTANENEPIPMDLVMVLDKKAVQQVAKLTSQDWFERRQQVERDYPGKIVVASWEWSPGQHVGPISVDVSPDFRAGFLFASYSNKTDHRAVISVRAPIVVNLQAEDFSVTALK